MTAAASVRSTVMVLLSLTVALVLIPPLVGTGLSQPANAQQRQKDMTHTSGLPIPRFVSLRSGEVNVRTGPNVRYPIEWVFVRKNMPVEITQEFDTWRRIRDWEGSEGWVHQSMLAGKRTIVTISGTHEVHREANPNSPIVARAEPGVMGGLHRCRLEWCEVDLEGYRGWTMRAGLWGVYPNETFE